MQINLHTYIYNIGVFKLTLSICSFYISCQLSVSEMTSMAMWTIIEGIRMVFNSRTCSWMNTQENNLVLKMSLHIKMSEC